MERKEKEKEAIVRVKPCMGKEFKLISELISLRLSPKEKESPSYAHYGTQQKELQCPSVLK